MLADERAEAVEDLAAGGRRDEAPLLVGRLGGRDGAVDVLGPDRGKVPISSPVAGLVLSKVSPEAASTHSPPMKFLKVFVPVAAMPRV